MSKNTPSMRRSIALSVIVGLLIPAAFINGYGYWNTYDTQVKTATVEFSQETALKLASAMAEPLWNLNHENALAVISTAISRHQDIVRIEVRNNKHLLFATSTFQEQPSGFSASAEAAIHHDGKMNGSLTVVVGSKHVQRAVLKNMLPQMLTLLLQIGLATLLILFFLERCVIRPLRNLNRYATRLNACAWEQAITWKNQDEIGQLAQQLENIRLRLQDSFGSKQTDNSSDNDQHALTCLALHESEMRLHLLIEQNPLAIVEWDNKLQVLEWNTAAERLFGYRREAAIGRPIRFLFPLEQRPLIADMFRQPSDAEVHSKQENLTAGGRLIICEWHCTHTSAEGNGSSRLLSIVTDITAQELAAKAQRLAQEKFAVVFQHNPEAAAITRLSDGALLEANAAFEKTLGFTSREYQGKTALQLRALPHFQECEELFDHLMHGKIQKNFPCSMHRKTGEMRHFLISTTLFTVEAETYALTVMHDASEQHWLTEQKAAADHALLCLAQDAPGFSNEDFFQLLISDLAAALRIDCAMIGLYCADDPQRIRALAAHMHGAAAERYEYVIHGTPYERTLKNGICIFTHDLQSLFPQDALLLEQGWDSYAGAPLRDTNGRVIGVLAIMHAQALRNPDLVKFLLQAFSERASAELERKRAEEELRLSEQRFATTFHSMPVPMFVTQLSDGCVIKNVNAAFEQLFLRSRSSVIGKNTLDLAMYCNPDDRDILLDKLKISGSLDRHAEIWMYRGDHSKILIQFSGHVFLLEGEQFGILACQDVTEKRLIENEILEFNATLEGRVIERTEELRQANQELETTLDDLNLAHEELVNNEKLAALGALVAGISHELNTPIGNSLMVASTLNYQTSKVLENYRSNKGIKRSSLEDYMSDVEKAGDILVRSLHRASDLVNSFKQVSIDQTSSQRRSFSLAEITSEILLTLWPVIRKTPFTIDQNIPSDLICDSYPGPLGQVLSNLINNALLHGFADRNQGTVTITAHSNTEGWVDLTIMDDGIGIPAASLNRIFDPFFTTKLGEGGSGLGLNIVHNIVSGVLGGRVRVQSAVGIGTTFTLTLPLIAPQRGNENDVLHPRI